MDPDERFAKYAELQREIADQAYSLFLYDQQSKHAFKEFVDWRPEENSLVMGYQIFAPYMSIDR